MLQQTIIYQTQISSFIFSSKSLTSFYIFRHYVQNKNNHNFILKLNSVVFFLVLQVKMPKLRLRLVTNVDPRTEGTDGSAVPAHAVPATTANRTIEGRDAIAVLAVRIAPIAPKEETDGGRRPEPSSLAGL